MLESKGGVFLALLAGHFSCFGDDWDGALGWVFEALVDGWAGRDLLMGLVGAVAGTFISVG